MADAIRDVVGIADRGLQTAMESLMYGLQPAAVCGDAKIVGTPHILAISFCSVSRIKVATPSNISSLDMQVIAFCAACCAQIAKAPEAL